MVGSAKASRAILAIVMTFMVVVVWGCRGDGDEHAQPTLEHSMKGYELYSWYEAGGWRYALVVGTNRIKTFDEIAASDVRLDDIDALWGALERLQQGEQIVWSAGLVPGTILAPTGTVDTVRNFCRQNGLSLSISEWPG